MPLNPASDSLSIVLPAFNEENSIGDFIHEILDYIPRHVNDFEIIVVDDGSTDSTQHIVREIQKPGIKLVVHQKNKGVGCAVNSGIAASTKEWVFLIDADGQFRVNSFKGLWANKEGHDFVLGFRRKRNDDLYRFLLGRTGNFITNMLLKKKITDINCGVKLFRRKDLVSLPLYSTGGDFSFEILYRLFKNKQYRFFECPVEHYPRKHGRQTGGDLKAVVKNIFEAIRLILYK